MTEKIEPLSACEIAKIKECAEAANTKDEWFVVGPPWLPRGVETYVVAGSPDPQCSLMVCDFQDAACAGVESDWDDSDWTARNWTNAKHIAASNPVAVLRLLATITALKSENEKLREALEPFSRLQIPGLAQGNAGAYSIKHSWITAARAALAETEGA